MDSEEPNDVSTSQQISLEVTLDKLLNDDFDNFEILNLLNKYSINVDEEESLSRKKYHLQRVLIEQILKEKPQNCDKLTRLLEETKRHINFRKKSVFFCCLSGCLFSAERHRSYLQHLKTFHHNHNKLVCNFKKKCKRQFQTLDALLAHVRECHSLEPRITAGSAERHFQVQEHLACKCDMVVCSGRKFKSVDLLMRHINVDHGNDQRSCIFNECSKKFPAGSTSRHHFRAKHKILNLMKLKPKHLVEKYQEAENVPESTTHNSPVLTDEEIYDVGELDALDNDEAAGTQNEGAQEETFDNKKFFMMNHCDFLNRLTNFKFIPAKTVTEIAKENLQNCLKSKAVRIKKLRTSLASIPNISEDQIEKVISESIEDDEYLEAQQELSSEYKRNKAIKEHFKYCAPVGIVLNKEEVKNGAKPDHVHYIPIKESFKHLVEDKSFIEVLEQERDKTQKKNPEILRDLTDGSAFRENSFFKQNPGAFAAHFYSDAVEVSNPLGWAKGRHKIVQIFYTIAQVPRCQRSQIDRIQLCCVFREKLVGKYGMKTVLSKLVDDLKDLEQGITIHFPVEREVKMGVLAYSADNLEAHCLAGFSSCFSSYDICRWCHCQHSDLLDNIHDFDGNEMKKYWSVSEYDQFCDEIEAEQYDGSSDPEPVTEENLFRSSDAEEFISDDDENADQEEHEEECNDDEMDEAAGQERDEEAGEEMDEEADGNHENPSRVRIRHGLIWRCPLNQLKSFHAVLGFPRTVCTTG